MRLLNIFLIAAVLAAVLWLRSMLGGWLLPDGSFLEALARQVQAGAEPVAEAVIGGVEAWLSDE